jgi:preprotein translocase subunit YajC
MLFVPQLMAEAPADPTQGQPGGSPLLTMLTIGMLFAFVYLFLMRPPAKRQEQERKALLANLKKNDEVVTVSGIIGVVANVSDKEDEVTLKVDESSNVRMRVLKSSIARNLSREKQAKEQKESKS